MPQRVHLPDGRVVNFPDGMAPQEIEKALSEISGAKPAETPQPEGKSLSGFLSNIPASLGRLVRDTVVGAKDAGNFASDLMGHGGMQGRVTRARQVFDAARNAPAIARAAGGALKDRYGSAENIGNTAYNDPAGVLADVSTALTLGSGAATRAPRLAGVLKKAESAINPLRVAEPAAKLVEYGVAGGMRPMLKPAKGLRRQQGGKLEIERTALSEGAFTEGRATAKQKAASSRATDAAASVTETTPRATVTAMPKSLDKVERGIEHGSDLDALARVEAEAVDSLPEAVTASQLLDKRRALDRDLNAAFRAAERGGAPTGIKQAGQKEMLGNIRGRLRTVAPGLREADDQSRRLGLVRSSLEEASLRAGDIPMGAGLLGGGLALGGIPGAAVAGGAFGMGRTFPQIPLALGSVPVRSANAVAAATKHGTTRRGMLLSALLERLLSEDQQVPR